MCDVSVLPRDPARTLAALWGLDTSGSRGPRQTRSVQQVAAAAIALADAGRTLDAVSMRRVAAELGVGTMTLYTYVQDRRDLVDLVVDRAYAEMYPDGVPAGAWPERIHALARGNWGLFERHPWLLDIDLTRPVMGPGETRKYDIELRAVDGIGLTDVAMDAIVSMLVGHTATAARRAREIRRVAEESDLIDDDEWWAANAPVFRAIAQRSNYRVAARVGSAVAEAQAAPRAADAELRFGIDRIVDAVAALIARPGDPASRPPTADEPGPAEPAPARRPPDIE